MVSNVQGTSFNKINMKWRLLTTKEKYYYVVRMICEKLSKPFYVIGNSATDKLNKSYFKALTK